MHPMTASDLDVIDCGMRDTLLRATAPGQRTMRLPRSALYQSMDVPVVASIVVAATQQLTDLGGGGQAVPRGLYVVWETWR